MGQEPELKNINSLQKEFQNVSVHNGSLMKVWLQQKEPQASKRVPNSFRKGTPKLQKELQNGSVHNGSRMEVWLQKRSLQALIRAPKWLGS